MSLVVQYAVGWHLKVSGSCLLTQSKPLPLFQSLAFVLRKGSPYTNLLNSRCVPMCPTCRIDTTEQLAYCQQAAASGGERIVGKNAPKLQAQHRQVFSQLEFQEAENDSAETD